MAERGSFVCYLASRGGSNKFRLPGRSNAAPEFPPQEILDRISFKPGIRVADIATKQKLMVQSASEAERAKWNQDHTAGVASWITSAGGITVQRVKAELASVPGLCLLQPVVFTTRDMTIAFSGYLSNTSELLQAFSTPRTAYEARLGGFMRRQVTVGPAWQTSGSSDTLEAEVVLRMFEHLGADRTLPLLKGRFSFAILDSIKNRIFAARDPSGAEHLYIFDDPHGGSYATSSSQARVPGELNKEEVPPGHYIVLPKRVFQPFHSASDGSSSARLSEDSPSSPFGEGIPRRASQEIPRPEESEDGGATGRNRRSGSAASIISPPRLRKQSNDASIDARPWSSAGGWLRLTGPRFAQRSPQLDAPQLTAGERLNKLMGSMRYEGSPGNAIIRHDKRDDPTLLTAEESARLKARQALPPKPSAFAA